MSLAPARIGGSLSLFEQRAEAAEGGFAKAVETARSVPAPAAAKAPANQVASEPKVSSSDGILTVDTGNGADKIEIEQDPSSKDVLLTVNGKESRHSDITTISINTNGGDDVVTTPGRSWISDAFPFFGANDTKVEAYVAVDAGAGDDKVDLSAVTGYDTNIVGGDGKDLLVGGHSSDCGDDSGFRTDTIIGDSTMDPDNADLIIAREDSSKQRAVIPDDPKDKVIRLPSPETESCTPEPEDPDDDYPVEA